MFSVNFNLSKLKLQYYYQYTTFVEQVQLKIFTRCLLI